MNSTLAFVANRTPSTTGSKVRDNKLHDDETSIKVILLGETNTGKTSLAVRFTSDEFSPYPEATIGASFFEPSMTISWTGTDGDTGGGSKTKVNFKIWDTAGQEKYHALASMYYRGAGAAIVVFDISRPSSFLTLKRWVEELMAKGPPGILLVVCGNKVDLEASGDRQVTESEASDYAKKIGAFYIETSAREKTNVKELFAHVATKAAMAAAAQDNNSQPPSNETAIRLGESQGSSRCCGFG